VGVDGEGVGGGRGLRREEWAGGTRFDFGDLGLDGELLKCTRVW
jgi:hypothetical protein